MYTPYDTCNMVTSCTIPGVWACYCMLYLHPEGTPFPARRRSTYPKQKTTNKKKCDIYVRVHSLYGYMIYMYTIRQQRKYHTRVLKVNLPQTLHNDYTDMMCTVLQLFVVFLCDILHILSVVS